MHELEAYAGRYIQTSLAHPDRPDWGHWLLADGTDVDDLVAAGDLERLDFVPRFRRYGGGGQVGDLVWTGGSNAKIASRRFVDVLESIGATGYRTYPAEVVSGRGRPLGDFVGLAIDPDNPADSDVLNPRPHAWTFVVTDRVLVALKQTGVTAFRCLPWPPDPDDA